MVFFAAPDIILDVEAEKSTPERAAQIYAINASRVMAIRRGGKSEVNQTHVAWTQTKGTPRRSFATLLQWAPLYGPERRHRFLPSRQDRRIDFKAGEREQWDMATRHPPPTARSTLHPRRAWWLCWMAVRN